MKQKAFVLLSFLLLVSVFLNLFLINKLYEQGKTSPMTKPLGQKSKRIVLSEKEYKTMRGLGSKEAPVKIVMFSDYECYYCHRFYQESFNQLKKDYIDKGIVQFFIKNFPSKSHHHGYNMAVLLSDLKSDTAFWKRHLEIMLSDQNLNDTFLVEVAQKSNLSLPLKNDSILKAKLDKEIFFAVKNGVYGIPAFAINGELYIGNRTYSEFKEIIEKAQTQTKPTDTYCSD